MCGGRSSILHYEPLIETNYLYAPTPNGQKPECVAKQKQYPRLLFPNAGFLVENLPFFKQTDNKILYPMVMGSRITGKVHLYLASFVLFMHVFQSGESHKNNRKY